MTAPLREHITHGYAIIVHSAQGATADATHAVLGETTTRALFYVALTRGRDTNHAYLYERLAGETEHEHADEPGVRVLRRGTSRDAAQLVRTILASHDDQAVTAHDIVAATEDRDQLPEMVRHFTARRAHAVARRRTAYRQWCVEVAEAALERDQWIDQHRERGRDTSLDYGLEL
ncbi:MAG TPA: helicase C-terminal domain-containing protein [Mycobacterium sp.]|nr:helicase C-terminal domain-containing protein [Mycobacterium sp.]